MCPESAKVPRLFSLVLLAGLCTAQPAQPIRRGELKAIGAAIVRHAARDVGTQERTWRNDHPLFDYYRKVGGSTNPKSSQGWREPYCGYAVYTWHRLAGVNPRVKMPGRAIAWSYHASKITLGNRTNPADIRLLEPGWVIGFRFNSNHVGVIEVVYPLYAQTVEGNTSLSGAVGSYATNHDGVIRKIRFYKSAAWAADWRGSPRADSLPIRQLRSRYVKPN